MTRTALLALLGIGALLAPCASAQTLSITQSGDNVTVKGTGTTGTYQGQANYNTTVNSYTGTATPGAAVTLNSGATFTLAAGGTLSGGSAFLSDGLDIGLSPASGGGVGTGTAIITGGVISGFDAIAIGGGTVTITGGSITGGTGLGAGLVAQLSVSQPVSGGPTINPGGGGTINLVGTGFLVNGQPAPAQLTGAGTLTSPLTITGLVSGTLADGERLSTNYQLVGPGTTINFLSPAPEPSQCAALGVGVLGVGVLTFKARRRA